MGSSSMWLVFPIILCSSVLLFVVFRHDLQPVLPRFAPFSGSSHVAANVTFVAASQIPINGVAEAFNLGLLYEKTRATGSCDLECIATFKTLVGVEWTPQMNISSLHMYDASQTIMQRAAAFLTLTNVFIVVGIIVAVIAAGGLVTVVIIPFLIVIAPVVVVVITALEPLHEVLLYATTFFILTQSVHYASHMAFLVWFCGAVIAMGAFFYSTFKHVKRSGGREKQFAAVVGLYCALIFACGAVAHRSSLLGFMACGGIFTALGFVVVPFAMGVAIGFNDNDAMQTCAATSLFFITATFVVAKVFPFEWRYALEPFRFALYAQGTFVFFLAMLIISSSFAWHYRDETYVARQMLFIFPLFAYFSIGMVYNVPSFVNGAGAFGVFWAMEKYVELARHAKEAFYFWLFCGGAALVWIGFFLQAHPNVIVSIFDANSIF